MIERHRFQRVAISSRDLALPRASCSAKSRNCRSSRQSIRQRRGPARRRSRDAGATRRGRVDQRGLSDPELVDQHHQRRIDAERVAPRGERSELGERGTDRMVGGPPGCESTTTSSRSVPRDEVASLQAKHDARSAR